MLSTLRPTGALPLKAPLFPIVFLASFAVSGTNHYRITDQCQYRIHWIKQRQANYQVYKTYLSNKMTNYTFIGSTITELQINVITEFIGSITLHYTLPMSLQNYRIHWITYTALYTTNVITLHYALTQKI